MYRTKLEKLKEAGKITEAELRSMAAGSGNQLNPDWVEWLMGFPTGWTDAEKTVSRPEKLTPGYWPPEPEGVPRLTERKDHRADRLKCLGNAVVPAQFFPVFRAIAEIEKEIEK